MATTDKVVCFAFVMLLGIGVCSAARALLNAEGCGAGGEGAVSAVGDATKSYGSAGGQGGAGGDKDVVAKTDIHTVGFAKEDDSELGVGPDGVAAGIKDKGHLGSASKAASTGVSVGPDGTVAVGANGTGDVGGVVAGTGDVGAGAGHDGVAGGAKGNGQVAGETGAGDVGVGDSRDGVVLGGKANGNTSDNRIVGSGDVQGLVGGTNGVALGGKGNGSAESVGKLEGGAGVAPGAKVMKGRPQDAVVPVRAQAFGRPEDFVPGKPVTLGNPSASRSVGGGVNKVAPTGTSIVGNIGTNIVHG